MARKKKRSKKLAVDPNLAAESSRYDAPIASREFLISVLHEYGAPLDLPQLIERLSLHDDPERQEALRRRLNAMIRDGQIIRNRKGGFVPVDEADLLVGRISAHADGFGFLICDNGADDIYLNARQMRRVLHGDRAIVCRTGQDHRGRSEGRIVDVIERANHQLVGRLHEEHGIYFIAPDNRRIHQDLLVPDADLNHAKPGDIVIADIVEQPTQRHPPVGRVERILGRNMQPGMETDIAIASHEIPSDWPTVVQREVSAIEPEVSAADRQGRRDIRELPLVTIDGEDARDFDDAVCCRVVDDGWRLHVAIADVSHYVTPDSALDAEAYRRGTSVYFPQRVVPMLPEELSNGLCSLRPGVDRLCMLCELSLDAKGSIKRAKFQRAVMHSHARLTYSQAASILIDQDQQLRKQYADVVPSLEALYRLYKTLQKSRQQRGAIEFESNESRFEFDRHGQVSQLVPVQRNDAHRLIEECMILANIAAARYLHRKRLPTLYRVHAPPTADRLDDLRAFLKLHRLTLSGGTAPSAKDYARLYQRIRDRADAAVLSMMMLRSMQQALYQPRNEGHFGLALEHYAHFTSPIRRYPDLVVHRAIAHAIKGGKTADFYQTHNAMIAHGEHCSMTERRADEATRDVELFLKCTFMQAHVGDTFRGIITGVTSFGLFIQLRQFRIDGLAHITSLDGDYYHFDQTSQSLTGERTGKRFSLGDELAVQVAAVNLDERKIDFQPVKSGSNSKRKKNNRGKKSKRR